MYVPKIKTPEGLKPITIVPDPLLLEAYLDSNISAEDKEVASWLLYLDDKEYAGRCLRSALNGSFDLKIIYPALGRSVPDDAIFICPVPDGALYLVRVPSKS